MSKRPFLSVVMPVHDGAQWISATLDSLVGEAAEGVEIIVLDSSSTPATADVLRLYSERLPLSLISRPDLPAWQAKTNAGVELAAADHVCILHQDDLWLPGRLEAIRQWIEQAPKEVLHLAPTAMIDRYGRRLGVWRCPLPAERSLQSEEILEHLLVQNFVSVPAPVFRRDAWRDCGGMDETLWYTPDWDIWLKLAAAGGVRYHAQVTTAFRIHGGSLTVTGSRNATEFEAQMRTVLDRHRPRLSQPNSRAVAKVADASIRINVALAAASGGRIGAALGAAWGIVALGPSGIRRYLRDSRLVERVVPRLRARFAGAY